MLISPSLLAADFSRLKEEVEKVSTADLLHLDVMDGHFVPNISMGPGIIASLRDKTALTFDVHLMLSRPLKYIQDFRDAGADIISFHIEGEDDPKEVIEAIKKAGAKPGIALKPATPAEVIRPYCKELCLVTVMTVEPGFGGQSLMEAPLKKIKEIKAMNEDILCEIDGGVNRSNLPLCRESGADILVAGTAVFRSPDPKTEIAFLRG